MHKIIILNLGSTSTKVSVYEDERLLAETTARITDEELAQATTQAAQIAFRKRQVTSWFTETGISPRDLDAAVVRVVGVNKCSKSGTYQIGDVLRKDIYAYYKPEAPLLHAGTMTVPLLEEIMGDKTIPMYIVDSINVDEFSDVARISGHPLIKRASVFHALNQKAIARAAAAELGKCYEDVNLVVAHLGGGVSIGAHHHGRVVDSSNCGKGCTGPFSPNRTGELPLVPLVSLCFSGEYTQKQIEDMLLTKGGFAAYLGVTDMREVEKMAAEGNEKAELLLQAFAYQVAKEIAAQCAVLKFSEVDAIVLTGGIAYSERIVADIKQRVSGLAPILVYAGEKEAEAMIAGALRVLRGQAEPILL